MDELEEIRRKAKKYNVAGVAIARRKGLDRHTVNSVLRPNSGANPTLITLRLIREGLAEIIAERDTAPQEAPNG